jgi:transposase InsO family protein
MNTFDSKYMILKEQKLKEILENKKKVVEVAKELNVTRKTIHTWLNRYKRFGIEGLTKKQTKRTTIAHNRSSFELEQLVIQLSQTYWNDGVQTLADYLQYENNITLNPSTLYRILKRNNVRYTTKYPHTRKKWKKRLYAHKVPGKELQMDTKYPFGYKQGQVIYTCIDDATRWVFMYRYDTANQSNTLDFLEKVRSKAPFPIQKLRTDQGSEFRGLRVEQYLRTHNIEQRLNTPYCPEENGKIERFHRTLNEKCLRFGFNPNLSHDEFQYKLNLFLYYYNYRRKHRGLGMDGVTPFARLQELSTVTLTLQCYRY